MSDFIDFEKAVKLRDVLKDATKPLAVRKTKKGKGGVTGFTEFDPAVIETMKLLVANGYGSSQISDKTPDGEARLNEFSRIVSAAQKEPESVASSLSGFDGLKLSQMFYVVNKRAMRDDRYLVEVVKGKCLLGILERAMELGQHRRFG